ncbi:glycerol 3-phosphate dehydrogenase (quinone) subunit B [Actinomyces ruminicola]|uniref:Glycerol 3-phosphate dehydrogenase (Quinone) subunit B n=1 Tax=Actinomyces ruminicola TaxID=332524 RepID=A0A1H0BKD1_9ACTO|nr:glycerol-3-phosphate dehydrogenase subunit GlpB [Actinomyces ruminicola]SDN46051.1 glycerol 3-phosphate dehydrogenase (quinone) subunit B [Actinomyces ruminicola]
MSSDVVVIGAGISGYAAALRLRRAGATVTLVTKGMGSLALSPGTVDVLGRLGGAAGPAGPGAGTTAEERSARRAVTRPYAAIAAADLLPEGHPYRVIGRRATAAGVDRFAALVGPELLTARPDTAAGAAGGDDSAAGPANLWLPTAVGAVRPTLLVQPSMQAAVLRDGGRYLVVGLARLKDFTAGMVAGNLSRSELPDGGRVQARALTVDFEARAGESDTNAVGHARALDDPAGIDRLARLLEGKVRDGETVLLPAVLGLDRPGVFQELAERLGAPVGEIPLVPPSVPGLRLEHRLDRLASAERVRVVMGARVVDSRVERGRLVSVTTAAAGRPREHRAATFVLAAGGFESGALNMDSHGRVTDTVLGLPLAGVTADGAENLRRLIHHDYWGAPQGLFRVGVAVDAQMRPLGADGEPALVGVHAVGGVLAGAVRWSEKSGEGIALGSAEAAGDAVLAELGCAVPPEQSTAAGRSTGAAGPDKSKEQD